MAGGATDLESMFAREWEDVEPVADQHLGRRKVYDALCLLFHCDEVLKNEDILKEIKLRVRIYGLKVAHQCVGDRVAASIIKKHQFKMAYFLSPEQEQKLASLTKRFGSREFVFINDLETLDILPGKKWDELRRKVWQEAVSSIPDLYPLHQSIPEALDKDAAWDFANKLVARAEDARRMFTLQKRQGGAAKARTRRSQKKRESI